MVLGYGADPAEVKAIVDGMVTDLLDGLTADTDPLSRYVALSSEQAMSSAVHDAYVAELKRLRGIELRLLADSGLTGDQIAEATGLGTKQRVGQLIAPKP